MRRPSAAAALLLCIVLAAAAHWVTRGADHADRSDAGPAPRPAITLTLAPPSAPSPAPGHTPTPTLAPSVQTQRPAASAGAGTGEDVEPEGEALAPDQPAVPADAAQQARFDSYQDQASAFVSAYARVDPVDERSWWAGVEPFLSAQARELYRDVDPGMVPFTRVTGPAAVMPSEAPEHLLVPVLVPTDAGMWLVEIGTDETGTWVFGISAAQAPS